MSDSRDAHGVLTTYAYSYNPHVTTATTGGRFTRTTLDGLGRNIKVETGDAGGTKSVVDTEYDSCACSPIGKVKRVSQPYAPGQTPVWTTYTYDALGRPAQVDLPGGSGTTTTSYLGNVTAVTDPAGKWKKRAARPARRAELRRQSVRIPVGSDFLAAAGCFSG